uniref:Large ribosomal subunit protein bL34c n=1 Tax=Pterocladia lucida TaxID=31408 RepID=A0A6M3WVM6_PTELU|nr:ribosomal protein L34 [Pterocladia lucida]
MSTVTLRGTNRRRIKKSGFRARMKTKAGQKIMNLRRRKKRGKISI